MSRLHSVFLMLAMLMTSSTSYAELQKIRITSIIDGDTIRIVGSGIDDTIRVRLYGIDAPESKQLHGATSTRMLKSVLAKTNRTYMENLGTDRYGRVLGIVYYDDIETGERINVNEKLLRYGSAWVYPQYCEKSFCSSWKEIEEKAKASRIGLWKKDSPVPPWEWRKNNKR